MQYPNVFTLGTALLLLASAGGTAAQVFEGQGHIAVLNSTDFASATAADTIGCLNAAGGLTAAPDGCAVFRKATTAIVSADGNCTFRDSSQPTNSDSQYGSRSYAWHCTPDYAATVYDSFYTVKGFAHPFLCHGDIRCYYDIKDLPSSSAEANPVWEFLWGGSQPSVPEGHVKVLWLWQPVA
ncbi:hypothetical protein GGS23DRAFT_156753 [Durotheca rogersii]|uniref:uncharacterized protein n=1 Tax=Durotheca rogersii TaxID=419775 RepID=UPI002220308E|nr:uncharacterized protein GGS23DRAFT_156753 [Durotheca rogersii]KAI5861169.1 hypothetical protein GGS23DRAFT_156753 [Durotheca rogersii]